MKFSVFLWLIIAGVLLVLGGFIYDVIFAGIPYQDATPEMISSYQKHSKISEVIMYGGLILITASIIVRVFVSLMKQKSK